MKMWQYIQNILGIGNNPYLPLSQEQNSTVSAGGHVIVTPQDSLHQQKTFFNHNAGVKALSADLALFECGHKAATEVEFDLWGRILPAKLKYEIYKSNGTDATKGACPFCTLDELLRISTRCARCGRAILPSDRVVLYDKESHGLNLDVATVVQSSKGDRVLGCLSSDCCHSDGFFAGRWTIHGFVPKFSKGRTRYEAIFSQKS